MRRINSPWARVCAKITILFNTWVFHFLCFIYESRHVLISSKTIWRCHIWGSSFWGIRWWSIRTVSCDIMLPSESCDIMNEWMISRLYAATKLQQTQSTKWQDTTKSQQAGAHPNRGSFTKQLSNLKPTVSNNWFHQKTSTTWTQINLLSACVRVPNYPFRVYCESASHVSSNRNSNRGRTNTESLMQRE
jgi:hypothetical protein